MRTKKKSIKTQAAFLSKNMFGRKKTMQLHNEEKPSELKYRVPTTYVYT